MAKQKKTNPEQNALDDIRVSTEKNAPQIEALVTEGKITAINGLKVLNGEMTLKDAKKEGVEKVEGEPETVVDVPETKTKRGGRASAIGDKTKLQSSADKVFRAGSIRELIAITFKEPRTVESGLKAILKTFTAPRSPKFTENPEAFVKSHFPTYVSRGWLKIVEA